MREIDTTAAAELKDAKRVNSHYFPFSSASLSWRVLIGDLRYKGITVANKQCVEATISCSKAGA